MSADHGHWPNRELYADAKAENECFEAGHPLNGDRCACGVVARAIRHRTCPICWNVILPEDAIVRSIGGSAYLHAECWNTPKDAA